MKININKKVIILIIIILAVSQAIFTRELNDLDELWNYNFARNILEGRLPYKEFNMIQTPLLPIIAAGFLAVLGNQLIVMRVLAIALITAILFMIYKILELLKLHKNLIYISVIAVYLLLSPYFTIDYNFMILLVILIVMYIELKNIIKTKDIFKYNFKSDFLLGCLIGISILLKHTTGLFISLICILYKLLLAKDKETFKASFKIIGTRLLGVLVPITILVLYLTVNNIFNDFIDYAIYGIKTFTNYIPYTNLIINGSIAIKLLAILVPACILLMYFKTIMKKIESEDKKLLFVIFAYSVGSMIVCFPISDNIHFLIGSIPTIIGIIYIGWEIILKLNSKKKGKEFIVIFKDYIKSVIKIAIPCLIIFSIGMLIAYLVDTLKYEEINHFKYISNSNVKENIDIVNNYILTKESEGKTVYILDASAAIYMIPLDKYNKDYDMFNIGNIGSAGEEGQIKKLETLEDNTILLIKEDNHSRNWQTPEKVRNYIINNWNKTGEIEIFDIYEKGI